RDGVLWILDGDGELIRFDPRSSARWRIGEAQGLFGVVQHVMTDQDGIVWVSTTHGLYRSAPGNLFEQVLAPGSGSPERFAMTAEDRKGGLWVAGDFGLARFSGGRWTRYSVANGLHHSGVSQVAADADGSVWIGYHDAVGISHLSFDA